MTNMKQLYEDKEKTIEAYPRIWLPVGSLYWNENDISDDIYKYFEGTWERVKDVFILAAGDKYSAKSSGGEETHKLTIDEMPEHDHKITWGDGIFYHDTNSSRWKIDTQANGGVNETHSTTHLTGGSQPHNNMPPYYTAYCWKRIS